MRIAPPWRRRHQDLADLDQGDPHGQYLTTARHSAVNHDGLVIDHSGLENVTANQHHTENHKARHATGGADSLADQNVSVSGLTVGGALDHDGSTAGFFGAAPVSKPTALTTSNSSTVDLVWGAEERDVLINLRTRQNELETKLRALGLLT